MRLDNDFDCILLIGIVLISMMVSKSVGFIKILPIRTLYSELQLYSMHSVLSGENFSDLCQKFFVSF